MSSDILKEGWLRKKGGPFKSWQRRYMRLYADRIEYAASDKAPKKGDILLSATSECKVGSSNQLLLTGTGPKTSYTLAANDSTGQKQWIEAISNVIATRADSGGTLAAAQEPSSEPEVNKEQPSSSPAKEQSASSTGPASSAAPESEEKKESKPSDPKPEDNLPEEGLSHGKPRPPEDEETPSQIPFITSATDDGNTTSADEWKALRDQVAQNWSDDISGPKREAGIIHTIRVFISSTFVDEHGERDELVRRVFNELNTAFRDRWLQIVPVDLRWGVSAEETSVIQQTCLNEIDNCRAAPDEAPWFIGLRGERYGWVQDKYDPPDLYNSPEYFGWLHKLRTHQQVSITSLEVLHATLGCHRSTRSRDQGPHAFMFFRDNGFKSKVDEGMRWLFDFEYLPEDASVPEAVKFQYTKIPKYQGFKEDLEELNQQLRQSADVCRCIDYFPTFGEPGDGSKVEKTGQLPTGKMFGVGYVGSLSEFGKQAYDMLFNQIDKEYPPLEVGTELDIERVQHKAVVLARSKNFLGRGALLKHLEEYALAKEDAEATPLVVFGRPGCGKSALMAQFAKTLDAKSDAKLASLIHIVGATSGSQSLRATLSRLCQELAIIADIRKPDIPSRTEELKTALPEFLEKASKKRRVVLMIDAVNQMHANDDAHRATWIPSPLPKNVRLIVSTLPEENGVLASIRTRTPAFQEMEVPLLSDDERVQLVEESLAQYHKKLTKTDDDKFLGNQMALLMAKEESGSPLYLIAAVEELRNFAVYEKMTPFIRDELPGTVVTLFKHLLDRLEGDHGKELVAKALSYIGNSRSGLQELEVIEMLENVQWQEQPRSNFSRLYAGLKIFISSGGNGLLQFFHQQLLFAVKRRYFPEDSDEQRIHSELAGYFRGKADPKQDASWSGNYPRGLTECVYHFIKAKQWDNVAAVMCDLRYLRERCSQGSGFDVVTDFLSAEDESSGNLPKHFGDFSRFFLGNVHILDRYPDQVVALAATYPESSALAKAFRQTPVDQPFLQHINKEGEGNARNAIRLAIRTHDEAQFVKNGCSITSDGSLLLAFATRGWAGAAKVYDTRTGAEKFVLVNDANDLGSCCVSRDGKLALVGMSTSSRENVVSVFSLETGDLIRELTGTESMPVDVDISADSRYVVAADKSNVYSWDLQSDKAEPLSKAPGSPHHAKILHGENAVLALGDNDVLKVYKSVTKLGQGDTKRFNVTLHNHTGHVTASPDGKHFAVSGHTDRQHVAVFRTGDKSLKPVIKDEYNGFCMSTYHAFSEDGSTFVACTISNDAALNEVYVYNLETGERLGSLIPNITSCGGVSITRDGGIIAVSGGNGLLVVIDKEDLVAAASSKSEYSYEPQRHKSEINFLGATPDGTTIVTSAEDMSVSNISARAIFWDAATGVDTTVHLLNVRHRAVRCLSRSQDPVFFVKQDQKPATGPGYTPTVFKLFDYPDFAQYKSIEGDTSMIDVAAVRASKDGKLLYVCYADWFDKGKEIVTYDISEAKEINRFGNAGPSERVDKVFDMQLVGDKMLTATKNGDVFLLSAADGTKIWSSSKADNKLYSASSMAAFHGNEKFIVTGHEHEGDQVGVACVFDPSKGPKPDVVLKLDDRDSIFACAVSPDDKFVAVGANSTVALFSTETWSLVAKLVSNSSPSYITFPSTSGPFNDAPQLVAAYKSGEVRVLRLVRSDADLEPVESMQKRVNQVLAANQEERSRGETGTSAGSVVKPAKNLLPLEEVPEGEGGKMEVTVDGKTVKPTTDKLFYRTKWVIEDGVMSANPSIVVKGNDNYGTISSLSVSVCPIQDDGEPNMMHQWIPVTGVLPQEGVAWVYEKGKIMSSNNGQTEMNMDRLPAGSYMIMVNVMGDKGMGIMHLVGIVQ